jgi:hypothetical protein
LLLEHAEAASSSARTGGWRCPLWSTPSVRRQRVVRTSLRTVRTPDQTCGVRA